MGNVRDHLPKAGPVKDVSTPPVVEKVPEASESHNAVADIDNIAVIGAAWRELRRGAAGAALRGKLFGEGDSALDPGQVDTLDLLTEREHWRMGDLADALKVDPSTATRAVQRLEKLGLAQRKALVTDGRVVTVAVTQAGRDRHAIISERRMKAIVEILTDFTPAEQATLAELLDRFVVAIGNVARTFEP